MSTLVQLVSAAADRFADAVAVIGPKRTVTYAELDGDSDRLAGALAATGVSRGDRVAIAEPRSADAIVAIVGILKTGASYVPIDPLSPPRRAADVIEACRIRCVVAPASWTAAVGELLDPDAGALLGGAAADLINRGGPRPEVAVAADDIAYILHTSGSTGRPKGVPLSHGNARFFVDAATELFEISSRDRLASQAPLHFDLSVFDIYCSVAAGAAVVIVPAHFSVFPKKISELIERHRISVWNSVVSTLLLLSERGKLENHDVESLRLVIFSGEPMPLAGLARLRAQLSSASFFNVYGQTEANSSLYYPVAELPAGAETLPIGRAIPGFDVFALGDDGAVITGPGAVGELHVSAPTVGDGYFEDPERSADKYVRDPRGSDAVVYRTGDRVRLDERGDFVFVGRTDNLIKTRGYRVELGEIERAIGSVDGVERAVAMGLPDPVIGNRIIAVVTASDGAEVTGERIVAAIAAVLPKYMIPGSIELRDSLPTTATGKIDRQKLRAEALEAAGGADAD